MYLLIAQAIGMVASFFIVLSFGQKVDNRFKGFLMIGNVLFAVHYFMLGGYAGMVTNLLNFLRVGSSIKFHKSKKIMWVFLGAYLFSALFVVKEPTDLLPIFASLIGTYSMFMLSGIKMRVVGLFASASWLGYGILYKSIGGMITDSVSIALTIRTIFKMKKEQDSK